MKKDIPPKLFRKKFHQKSKGISPLIAAVLLIAFTITIATFLASWSTTFTRSKTEEFSRTGEEITAECQYARLVVENAVYDSSNGKITAVVWNMGKTDLSDFQFNIYYSDVNITKETPSNYNITLKNGDFATFVVNATTAPQKIQVRSLLCPTESIYSCIYTGNKFNC